MGIYSLLMNLRSISVDRHLSDYRNQSAGVDGYSWLHKALHSCGIEVAVHNNLNKFVKYFQKKILALLHYNIKPIIVFDGDKLPLKQRTEGRRHDNRVKNYELAMECYRLGKVDEANKLFSQSIDITPDMAHFVVQKLREIFGDKVHCLVSPYEADSQLAYLSKIGMVEFVITEDSDLLVFGARVMFYKMAKDFSGVEVKLENLGKATELDLSGFDHDRFIQLCVLSGCDYLPSPKGIGFKKAHALMVKHNTVEKAIAAISEKVTTDYYNSFLAAYLAFKYQRVYCPLKSKIVSLNDLNTENLATKASFDYLAAKKCYELWGGFEFLGAVIDPEMAKGIAECELDPTTKKSFYKEIVSTKGRRKEFSSKTTGSRLLTDMLERPITQEEPKPKKQTTATRDDSAVKTNKETEHRPFSRSRRETMVFSRSKKERNVRSGHNAVNSDRPIIDMLEKFRIENEKRRADPDAIMGIFYKALRNQF